MMNEMDGIVNNLGKSRNFPDMIAKNDTCGVGQVGALVLFREQSLERKDRSLKKMRGNCVR
jgi:hypothetical protein